MIEIYKASIIAIVTLSLWCSLQLCFDTKGLKKANLLLALLIALLCIPQLYFYSVLVTADGLPRLGLLAYALLFIKGPILWALVKLTLKQPLSQFFLHCLPFACSAVLLQLWPNAHDVMNALGALHLLGYLTISVRGMLKEKPTLALIHAEFPNTAYYWLLWLLAGMATLALIDIVLFTYSVLIAAYSTQLLNWLSWSMSIYLLSIAFFSLYRPSIFYSRTPLSKRLVQKAVDITSTKSTSDQALSPRPTHELNASTASELMIAIKLQMDNNQIYLKNNLSLIELAGTLQISTHQCSELLNRHLHTNFYDYLNKYRIEYACTLLRSAHSQQRILDIAYESGFNSKNAFYAAFKSHTGLTPTSYRKTHQALAPVKA